MSHPKPGGLQELEVEVLVWQGLSESGHRAPLYPQPQGGGGGGRW